MLTRGINDGTTINTPSIAAVISKAGRSAIKTVVSTPTTTVVTTVVTTTVAVPTTTTTITSDTMVDFVIVTTTVFPLLPVRIERSYRTPSSGNTITANKPRVSIRQLRTEGKKRERRFCKKVADRSSHNVYLQLLKEAENDN